MICLTPKTNQRFFAFCIQSKGIFFTNEELFMEKWRTEKNKFSRTNNSNETYTDTNPLSKTIIYNETSFTLKNSPTLTKDDLNLSSTLKGGMLMVD